MGSGVIYYEIEKREKYEDSDEKADSDLAIVRTQRYHFEDEPFIHSLHSVRFDLDRPYESRESTWIATVSFQDGSPYSRSIRGETTQELGTHFAIRGMDVRSDAGFIKP
ncbi:hypothetical protein PIB30_081930 [Stylosanthes scabra]|uniref:Uncharacterized protein n=1 Tax=Stylosanthes scabra TaxID=79078 RepID=A0ABU6WRI9_9FABA|nr:hypothetical protein [Stylosanthes scabra]